MQRTAAESEKPRTVSCIAVIVTFVTVAGAAAGAAVAAEPPPNLAKLVADRETVSEEHRSQFTYRLTLRFEEFDSQGGKAGEHMEHREIVFLPSGDRTEKAMDRPKSTLKRLKLTEEDFRDVMEIQSLLFSKERLFLYETRNKGEEVIDGIPCWVLQIRPRQMLAGMRFFDGLFWVAQDDLSVIRTEGRAVPQVLSTKAEKENLFPVFRTTRRKIGNHWFPVLAEANDTLPFRTGPLQVKVTIRYADYQQFKAESTIQVVP